MADIQWKTEEEIIEERNKPKPPTPDERVAALEEAVLALLMEG